MWRAEEIANRLVQPHNPEYMLEPQIIAFSQQRIEQRKKTKEMIAKGEEIERAPVLSLR